MAELLTTAVKKFVLSLHLSESLGCILSELLAWEIKEATLSVTE